jgi:hypothetical protein
MTAVSAQDSGGTEKKPTPEKPAEQPRPEEKPKEEPKPEPKRDSMPSFGDPVTMTVPESVKTAMRDQSVAITRLGLLFDGQAGKDGIALEFEDMRTEIPVVFAAFVGDKCDQELTYKDWLARNGRYVDLTFLLKTMPQKLDGLEVSVEHLHLRGESEVAQSTFKAADVEIGKPFSVRLRGCKPGINRYRLNVSYRNREGKTTAQQGFSHWLIVQAPPMFEFATEPSCLAQYRKLGQVTVITADTTLNSSFMLHNGISAKDCELRVMRRGTRECRLQGLANDVRRIVGDETPAGGWEEVGKVRMSAKLPSWLKLTVDDAGFVKLGYTHTLSVTGGVLPLNESWEYRFELRHSASRDALAAWKMNIGLKIERAEDIARARVIITATGLEKALEVPLVEKKQN